MALKNWIEKEICSNSLFSYDFIALKLDQEQQFNELHRKQKSYLLEWAFENVAQGYSELLTPPPSIVKQEWIDKFQTFYKKSLYPLYKARKNAFLFQYGKRKSYSDIYDVDITSKAFGANDNYHHNISDEDKLKADF